MGNVDLLRCLKSFDILSSYTELPIKTPSYSFSKSFDTKLVYGGFVYDPTSKT